MHGEALVVALAVLAFGLVAGRLRGTSLTMPMVFTAAGLLLGPAVLGVLEFRADDEVVSVLAEVTLAVVLFTGRVAAARATPLTHPARRIATRRFLDCLRRTQHLPPEARPDYASSVPDIRAT